MRSTHSLLCLLAAAAILAATASAPLANAGGKRLEIDLPPETAILRSSELPGYQLARGKCAICHSADYINLQPPHLSLAQWTGEVTKMQHAYGAPIDDVQVKSIAVYLTATYGDAASIPRADLDAASASTACAKRALLEQPCSGDAATRVEPRR
jgi:mono/diheme cytochrome c family protein